MENNQQRQPQKVNKIKEYFSTKTSEQIFSLCLLIGVVALMLFCCIVRLCGKLWFTADLTNIKEPSKAWQEIIVGVLMAFELTFAYKLLCRRGWWICIIIAICETLIGVLIGYLVRNLSYGKIITNAFYALCIFIVPLPFVRNWFSLIDSTTLYLIEMLYCLIFMVGRIGNIDINATYNFVYSVLGTIDFKLFIVALFLIINYFGGIRLWKKQKRLILMKNLTKE